MCHAAAGRLINLLRAGVSPHQAAEIHAHSVISGLSNVPHLFAALVSAYAHGGAANEGLLLASSAACGAAGRVVGFTSLIATSSRGQNPLRALSLFSELRRLDLRPNQFTFSAAFPACTAAGALAAGEHLHALVLKQGLLADVFVCSAAVDMYAKCGGADLARQLFDEIPHRTAATWNALLVNLPPDQAQALFRGMLAESLPEEVSFSTALRAAAAGGATSAAFGRQVHASALKLGHDSATYVTNALIDMYSKCSGEISAAAAIFSGAGERDAIAWNTLAAGLLRRGEFEQAVTCFSAIANSSCYLDEASFSTALHAAAAMAASSLGAALHAQSIHRGLATTSTTVVSSLIAMYAKCGDLNAASAALSETEPTTAAFSAMIAAYKQHGQAQNAVELFERMTVFRLQPDYTTFISVLSACSHGGLVEKGLDIFKQIADPGKEHYACVVDMLGRAGKIAEARAFMAAIPAAVAEDASIWGAILAASFSHGDMKMGEEAARRLFELEPENSGNYIILSNMYRREGKEKASEQVRREMGMRRVKKETSCSWIDVQGGGAEVFRVQEREHRRSPEIYKWRRSEL